MNIVVIDPESLKEMEQEVVKNSYNLKATQDKWKIYADKHMMNKEFSIGDHVYLGVKVKKSSLKLGSCAKLSPIYCGQFEVIEIIGPVAYRIAFPASTTTPNVFHVSLLKKYVHDLYHVHIRI